MRLAVAFAIAISSFISAAAPAPAASFHGIIVGKDGQVRPSRGVFAVLAHDKGNTTLTFTMDYAGGGDVWLWLTVPAGAKLADVKDARAAVESMEEGSAPRLWMKKDINPMVYLGMIIDCFDDEYAPRSSGGCTIKKISYRAIALRSGMADGQADAKITVFPVSTGKLPAKKDFQVPDRVREALRQFTGPSAKTLAVHFTAAEAPGGYTATPPITIKYGEEGDLDFAFDMAGTDPLDVTLVSISSVGRAAPQGRRAIKMKRGVRIPFTAAEMFQENYQLFFNSMAGSGEGAAVEEFYAEVSRKGNPYGHFPAKALLAMGAGWLEKVDHAYVTRLHYLQAPGATVQLRLKQIPASDRRLAAFYAIQPYVGLASASLKGIGHTQSYFRNELAAATLWPPGLLPLDWEAEMMKTKAKADLLEAAAKNRLEMVKKAVESGVDVNMTGDGRVTLLGAAAWGGAGETVAWLAAHGADKDAIFWEDGMFEGSDENWVTPISLAVKYGRGEAIKALAAAGVDVSKPLPAFSLWAQKNGSREIKIPPLVSAVDSGDPGAVLALLELGADVNAKDPEWGEAVYSVPGGIPDSKWKDVFRILAAYGARIDFGNERAGGFLTSIAEDGDENFLMETLKRADNFDPKSYSTFSALSAAAGAGHKGIVRRLLDLGAPPDWRSEQDGKGREASALMAAMGRGRLDVARLLVERGAKVNVKNGKGHSALYMACEMGQADLAATLVARGAKDPEVAGDCGTLASAAWSGDMDLARQLLASGANVNMPGLDELTPLQLALKNGRLKMAGLLMENGAHLSLAGSWGESTLDMAVNSGDLEMVKTMLAAANSGKAGLAVTTEMAYRAAAAGQRGIFDYLRQNGHAREAFEPGNREKLLYSAANGGMLDLVKNLVGEGASANFTSHEPGLLAAAARGGHLEVAGYLIEKGARVTIDKIQATPGRYDEPLPAAVEGGNVELARKLLLHGANPDIRDRRSATPLCLASKNGNTEMAQALLDHGASVDLFCFRAPHYARSPLMTAAFNGNAPMVKAFLAAGADQNLLSSGGETAFDFALQSKNPETIALLAPGDKKRARLLPEGAVLANRRFGNTVSLSFSNAEVSLLLKIVRDVSGVQVFTAPGDDPSLNIQVTNKPLYEALQTILENSAMVAVYMNGALYVGSQRHMTVYNPVTEKYEFNANLDATSGFKPLPEKRR